MKPEPRGSETATGPKGRNGRTMRLSRLIRVLADAALEAPGSGKTAILERTLQDLGPELKMATVVGDLATDNDALRLRKSGAPSVQITTGTVCHLDAHMVQHAVEDLALEDDTRVLFIEA